ncbi:MAG: phenylalanine--tRNA ligase subunit beta [Desulfobacterales bacterium]|jgi:phenylalanyl-tRNA synthetase beta chain|nr:phenylalanine--tRNA ligase subunit beta [Desulfobacterales bacterium]
MKVSLRWLKEYVPIQMAVKELADALTMTGLEVESITDRFACLQSVLVGRILTVAPHPNADRLSICNVDTSGARHIVVCGAPNAAPGILVPVALPGTVLPNGMEINSSVIRGQRSDGMLCGESELGLGPDSGGLMILNEKTPVGQPLPLALGLSDVVFEIGLTPNRPDCLSMIGIAREVAAIQKLQVRYPETIISDRGAEMLNLTSVTIEAPAHCPRYAARLIQDIQVAPSPFWLQDRLLSIGLRPINNIVDITNFVMMETGQPLHAFDFDLLAENRIVVRTASDGETFVTLDGKERRLTSEMLMICDGKKPVALAGVMGGLNSEIVPNTTRVLLESACFSPQSIRKTAKLLGLATDASHRFERGVDPHGTINAMNRAAQLMVDITGGCMVSGYIDDHPGPNKAPTITLSVAATNRLLGTAFNPHEILDFLSLVEIAAKTKPETASDLIQATPPSYRVDISRPEDLIEEVARLSGYNKIPTTLPAMPAETVLLHSGTGLRSAIRTILTGIGFFEAINYSFIHPDACDRLQLKTDDTRRNIVRILNPLSEDQAVMRSSLIPGLLETMRRNNSKQIRELKLFEIGQTFTAAAEEDLPEETEIAAALWTGLRSAPVWHEAPANSDFYDIKGALESLLSGLGIKDACFTRLADDDCTYTKPGYTAGVYIGDLLIGLVGEVHPQTLRHFDLRQTAYIFELDIAKISRFIPTEKTFAALSKFPATSRDVTLIIDKEIETQRILEKTKAGKDALLESVHLFDVFEGKPIPEGKKSVSFRITYRSTTETLADELINNRHQKISEQLIREFKADLPA